MLHGDSGVPSASPPMAEREPFLYAVVCCEGSMVAEAAAHPDEMTLPALRSTALRVERGLLRAVSFCSQIERPPRGSRIGIGMSLPPKIAVHVLRRHGHTFIVVTVASLESELANRFCEEACSLFGCVLMGHAQNECTAGAPPAEVSGSGARATASRAPLSWRNGSSRFSRRFSRRQSAQVGHRLLTSLVT